MEFIKKITGINIATFLRGWMYKPSVQAEHSQERKLINRGYSWKWGIYITLTRIISGDNKEVAGIYPKWADNSIHKYEAWETG